MHEKILVIDDDPKVLAVLTDMLSGTGYRVLGTSTAEEGYALARSRRPHAIILDLHMPGMDGGELAEKLRLDPRTGDIPVLICSGLVKRDEIPESGLVGRHQYMAKPPQKGELLERVRRLIGGEGSTDPR